MKVKAGWFEFDWELKEIWDFVFSITPQFIKDTGWIISDQFQYWRSSRMLNLLKKWKSQVEDSWLPIHEISPKLLLPIVEYWSLEMDNDLQSKWSNLLSNATVGQDVKVSYAEILKELDTQEVKILDWMFYKAKTAVEKWQPSPHSFYDYDSIQNIVFKVWDLRKEFNLSDKDLAVIIDNCFRLRLLWSITMNTRAPKKDTDNFLLTHLWEAFIKACKFWE